MILNTPSEPTTEPAPVRVDQEGFLFDLAHCRPWMEWLGLFSCLKVRSSEIAKSYYNIGRSFSDRLFLPLILYTNDFGWEGLLDVCDLCKLASEE